ncbi:hypothetical protein IQ03_01258 [Gemmobacter caeni]|uniref:Endonuclease YncB(Thermonuclease family) n=1 Tax=Gemmobacter caeni TaxID=589035 RepID=A0A2T6B8V1_9RHOB|nr:hypothetical protein [Gemmobacter caeni]PTX52489.1 hypothetical protein C8N34_102269 [Gemmobacter caeni]TWJ02840.1 hypothetical protein IQ03_01258 [Gemmobacter caeni]
MRIRALTSADLAAFNVPDGAFRVPSFAYRVVDGDTIKLMSGRSDALGRPMVAARLRFRSMAAPELRRSSWSDASLLALGVDPNRDCPGHRARETLVGFVRGRDLIVSHQNRYDPHGRLLCDICVLPTRDAGLEEAVSLERVMIARGVAQRFIHEPLPPLRPYETSPFPRL